MANKFSAFEEKSFNPRHPAFNPRRVARVVTLSGKAFATHPKAAELLEARGFRMIDESPAETGRATRLIKNGSKLHQAHRSARTSLRDLEQKAMVSGLHTRVKAMPGF